MPGANRQRVLVMSGNSDTRHELVTLLSGYGYFVEESQNRVEGVKKFRAHKQPIVILDLPMLRFFPRRLLQFFQKVRKNTIVLIAAHKREEDDAFQYLKMGAYDLLYLPLKTDSLKMTLSRALNYHQVLLNNIFINNAIYFGLLALPIWLALGYVLMR